MHLQRLKTASIVQGRKRLLRYIIQCVLLLLHEEEVILLLIPALPNLLFSLSTLNLALELEHIIIALVAGAGHVLVRALRTR